MKHELMFSHKLKKINKSFNFIYISPVVEKFS